MSTGRPCSSYRPITRASEVLATRWTRDTFEALCPYADGRAYVNFMGEEEPGRVRAAYGERRYARLVALKRRFDPDNVFRLNQNIAP